MDAGTNRATSEMEGGNLKKASKAQLIRIIESLGDKASQKLAGLGMHGGKISRIKKANKWQTFVDSTIRDTIDTAGKAANVYYDSTSPLSQAGFGLKKHKRLSGRALLAAGYS